MSPRERLAPKQRRGSIGGPLEQERFCWARRDRGGKPRGLIFTFHCCRGIVHARPGFHPMKTLVLFFATAAAMLAQEFAPESISNHVAVFNVTGGPTFSVLFTPAQTFR